MKAKRADNVNDFTRLRARNVISSVYVCIFKFLTLADLSSGGNYWRVGMPLADRRYVYKVTAEQFRTFEEIIRLMRWPLRLTLNGCLRWIFVKLAELRCISVELINARRFTVSSTVQCHLMTNWPASWISGRISGPRRIYESQLAGIFQEFLRILGR